MIIAFQVILLITILISVLGVVGEKKDEKLQENITFVCVISMITLLVTVIWL